MKNILLFTLLLPFSSVVFGQQKSVNFKSDEILVRLQANVSITSFLKEFNQQNPALPKLKLKQKTVPRLNIFSLNFAKNQTEITTVLEKIRQHPQVLAAQLNYQLEMRDSIPNDPLFIDQWSLDRIQVPDVWAFSTGGTSFNEDEIVIAVIDSGFDVEHEDLQGNIWENTDEISLNSIDDDDNGYTDDLTGWNFMDDLPYYPITSHGTSVAGIIGAKGNNDTGVTGVNWNVKLMLLTAEFSSEIIAAYGYVLEQRILYNETNGEKGAFVVVTNSSFGINNSHCEDAGFIIWNELYDLMGEAGIVSVGATSNSRNTNVDLVGDMPTSCPSDYLITVTNSDFNDEREGGFGATTIDLAAPGSQSTTTDKGSNYDTNFGGTSAACPHVAGAVGLLFSLPCEDFANLIAENPAASALLMKKAILAGVDPLNDLQDETVTGGRLNVFNSMQYLHSYCVARDFERENDTFMDTYIDALGFVRIFSPAAGSDRLMIDFSAMNFAPIEVGIYNSVGQLMFQDVMQPELFNNQSYQLDVQGWAAGAYFISVLGIKAKVTEKFVLSRAR